MTELVFLGILGMLVILNWGLGLWLLARALAGWRCGEPHRGWVVLVVALEWLGPALLGFAEYRYQFASGLSRGWARDLANGLGRVGTLQLFGLWPVVAVPLFLRLRRGAPATGRPVAGPILVGAVLGPLLLLPLMAKEGWDALTKPIPPDMPEIVLFIIVVLPAARLLGLGAGFLLWHGARWLRPASPSAPDANKPRRRHREAMPGEPVPPRPDPATIP